MRALDISSKEAYLQWVGEWKEEYKKTSARLREIRIELSKPHEVKEVKGGWGSYFLSSASGMQSERMMLKVKARILLEIRAEGKKQSWAAKQEALRQGPVAKVETTTETPNDKSVVSEKVSFIKRLFS